MKQTYTREEVDDIENKAYEVGISVGRTQELERILKTLKINWATYCTMPPNPEECHICWIFDELTKKIEGQNK